MATNSHTLQISDEQDLLTICQALAKHITLPCMIGLSGDLGTGKTTFVRYLSEALGSTDWVNSPTYSIIQQYTIPQGTIVHVDLYRCTTESDIDTLDLFSNYTNNTLFLIEWVEQSSRFNPDIHIQIDYPAIDSDTTRPPTTRRLTFTTATPNLLSVFNAIQL
jgi:tRNA threonylcarbamoyladenosine biosynthesis protein TsaE